MIVSVAGAIVRLNVALAVWIGEPESVTLKETDVEFTGVVGVPLMRPAALRLNPAGKVPALNCQE